MNKELYRIVPLEKKSIKNAIEVYRQNEDESISWFNIEDHYRWGNAFVESKDEFPFNQNQDAYCDPRVGWGVELEDHVAFFIEFSDDISQEEREEIEENYLEYGSSWLYDGEHNWAIEDDMIVVSPPYRIDQVDPEEYGTVLKEDVKIE